MDFVVNAEKKTVVAIGLGVRTRKLHKRGIAKCMPGDVFNEWIGKAIALARALEIEVPTEFLGAVQPSEFAVGQTVQYKKLGFHLYNEVRVITKIEGNTLRYSNGKRFGTNEGDENPVIVDDTIAVYAE